MLIIIGLAYVTFGTPRQPNSNIETYSSRVVLLYPK